MAFYNEEKYAGEKAAALDAITASLKKYYPKITFTPSVITDTFNYYMDVAVKLNSVYSAVNPEENKKSLSDIWIKSIYMVIKGISDPAALTGQKTDTWLRDQIWMTLSEIKRVCAGDARFNKFYNPSKFVPVVTPARPVLVPARPVPAVTPARPVLVPVEEKEEYTISKPSYSEIVASEKAREFQPRQTNIPAANYTDPREMMVKYWWVAAAGAAALYLLTRKR